MWTIVCDILTCVHPNVLSYNYRDRTHPLCNPELDKRLRKRMDGKGNQLMDTR